MIIFRTVNYFSKTHHLQLVKPYLRSVQNLNNKVHQKLCVFITVPTVYDAPVVLAAYNTLPPFPAPWVYCKDIVYT